MPVDERPTVYSTEPDFEQRCPRCGKFPCRCPKLKSRLPQQQTALLRRERKGRGGKTVTIVDGLQLAPGEMKELARLLKQTCGSGGTVKGDVIEIQGDHRQVVMEKLRSLGYRTKMVGG